ncbi:epoxyqueuosine reductase QueH [Helicobacter cappadocius]|uniref:Epoxyqueuosine reductase QueH n=1 Tax=Helicobacter cappadocius TaxID=3063998 RepID=A0AA90PTC1_9HELI|nr:MULTISPECIES: epoxyqueuosine reductase QueH [unclassified Helicobacter]MDO7252508.1 epoxyqueuosine reductase QueH [Helicobacter sp. faydin-H75]MDP2538375.1 epoxyqueuosine reductase QueH [Helicobacter sp. faydin-H76]
MLVHICCSVDSHYFLSELTKIYPHESFVGFFYNPNIHPKSEHDLRLSDVKRSCDMLGIQLIEGEYDTENWFDGVRGLEKEPEKGNRCTQCFDIRLIKSASIAKRLGEKKFTTTLLSSPMKEQKILYVQGDSIAQKEGLEFIKIDVRSNGGTQKQNELAKADNLYRQNYCGCNFALEQQRNSQKRFSLEMMSHIGSQILPGSIEERRDIFSLRNELEKYNKEYILTQRKYMVWRLLSAKVERGGNHMPSYIIAKSQNKKDARTGPIFWIKPNIFENTSKFYNLEKQAFEYKNAPIHKYLIGYSKKDDSVFVHLDIFNMILNTSYKNIKELLYNPPKYDDEIFFRNFLCGDDSINPIIIIDEIYTESLRINIKSIFQEEIIFRVIENL